MPRHPVARKLIELAGVPVAAPSANSFGRTSPTRAEFVLEDLDGRIDAVIDSGDTTLGLESTVVDVCEEPPILYRPGMVTLQQLQSLCPSMIAYREPQDGVSGPQASPGIGLKHYSPRARLLLVENADTEKLFSLAAELQAAGETVGVMLPAAPANEGPYLVYEWGDLEDQEKLARRLFAGLRELDAAGATVIVCPLPENLGLGVAIRDRLLRPPVELVGIRRFIQIFNARLIDERAQCAVPHFDRIAVIPLDRALDLLPTFQHKNHHGSAVNLLLKVKRLCVRALPAYCCGIQPLSGE